MPDSLCKELATGIAALAIDDAPVYAGFGPTQRPHNYWQVVPSGGGGVGWYLPTGALRDANFQINRFGDVGSGDEVIESADALREQLNGLTGWAVGGYRVEVCEAISEILLMGAPQPGEVVARFNIRVAARKVAEE